MSFLLTAEVEEVPRPGAGEEVLLEAEEVAALVLQPLVLQPSVLQPSVRQHVVEADVVELLACSSTRVHSVQHHQQQRTRANHRDNTGNRHIYTAQN